MNNEFQDYNYNPLCTRCGKRVKQHNREKTPSGHWRHVRCGRKVKGQGQKPYPADARCGMVMLIAQGVKVPDVSRKVGLSEKQVYYWLVRNKQSIYEWRNRYVEWYNQERDRQKFEPPGPPAETRWASVSIRRDGKKFRQFVRGVFRRRVPDGEGGQDNGSFAFLVKAPFPWFFTLEGR